MSDPKCDEALALIGGRRPKADAITTEELKAFRQVCVCDSHECVMVPLREVREKLEALDEARARLAAADRLAKQYRALREEIEAGLEVVPLDCEGVDAALARYHEAQPEEPTMHIEFEPEDQTSTPNIRLLAAVFYLYCVKYREGWEEGPGAEECWSRICDEVANTIGSEDIDVEKAGRWLAANDRMIRESAPWLAYKRIRAEVLDEPAAPDRLAEAASDVVTFCDKVEGVAEHARCVVKRKYIDRLDEILVAYEAGEPTVHPDTERLDWLIREQGMITLDSRVPTYAVEWNAPDGAVLEERAADCRDAIDAARASDGGETQ